MDNSLVEFETVETKTKRKRSGRKRGKKCIKFDSNKIEELEDLFFRGIAENISIEIEKKNYSITDVAYEANVSTTHLFRVLNGDARIGLNSLFLLSLVLEKNPADFLPTTIQSLQTNGQIYDEITKMMDPSSNNALLGFVAAWAKEWKRVAQ